jgi:diacylglycerol kinase family enzyme
VGRVNGRRFAFSSGLGFDAEVVRRVDAFGRRHDGRRPGDVRFALTLARMLLERRARYDPALEIEGWGRAAFALVGNASPYTYVGSVRLPILPEAQFELGLDLIAPVKVRPRNLPRLVRYALRGARKGDPNLVYAHDVDRIEIRCDRPMPLHVDGEDLGDVEHASFDVERDALSVVA